MNKQTFILIGVIVLVTLGGGYYLMRGQGGSTTQPQSSITDEFPESSGVTGTVIEDVFPSEEVMEKGEVKEFIVEGSPFQFSVKEMRVNKGDTVKVTFNVSNGTHDWVIDKFETRTNVLNKGGSETVQFVADEVGTFEYYCSVGNHRQQGMVGKLIVE